GADAHFTFVGTAKSELPDVPDAPVVEEALPPTS
ncbi:MAG: hypothetical protein QOD35_3013, partial [Nocardioidaceae bacterium]|nr:hypothetical protein [Nocardioidaceae bacterium]